METTAQPDPWEALANTIGKIVTTLDKTVDALVKLTESYDSELAEIRDGIVDLDHKLASHVYHQAMQTAREAS